MTVAVMRNNMADHVVPRMTLTDQGPYFENNEFTFHHGQLGIKRVGLTPYHLQTSGLTGQNNHTLKDRLAAKKGNWKMELPMML